MGLVGLFSKECEAWGRSVLTVFDDYDVKALSNFINLLATLETQSRAGWVLSASEVHMSTSTAVRHLR